ncbi:MAG TPA: XdhC family protein [Acidimicrobiia bacterium]|jgi:xanthine dehydrogenase accessory factor|nr:XdhC family protein [Acidimicrobiia bacterium]
MYSIALTVAACLQAGTRADVAWIVASEGLAVSDPSDAVVFTPGGGRIGGVAGGALDGKLADHVGRLAEGRLVELEVSEVDALIAGLASGGRATCLVIPAETIPGGVWDLALERRKFCLDVRLADDTVVAGEVYWEENVADADDVIREAFQGPPGSTIAENRVVSVFSAVPQLIVVGGGPIAEALVSLGAYLGWQSRLSTSTAEATGLIATTSANDMVVVAAHDLELAGSALAAALDSGAGYIGSVGSHKMQGDRADWLAYRGKTDLSRVRGPAGLDIGADSPEEIAVSIVAEAIAERASAGRLVER